MRLLAIENNLEVEVYLGTRFFEDPKQSVLIASLHFERPRNPQGELRQIQPKKKFEAELPDNTAIELDADEIAAFVTFACVETQKEIYFKITGARKGRN